MSLQLAHQLASQGRGNDSTLVHMSPKEVGALQAIAAAHGGQLTINPHTGLPEAGFLEKLLPMIAGAALASTGIGAPMAGLLVGGGTALATGSLNKGIMAGLGAYGGGGLGSGLMAAGEAAAPAVGAAAPAAATMAPGTTALGSEFGTDAAFKAANPSFVDKLSGGFSQMGQGAQRLASGEGWDKFIGNEATKTSGATGLGGGMGAFKYAGAAAMPMMADSGSQLNANPQGQGNIVDYSFDPITGQYRKLRTTPTSQYPGMAKGGITEALGYADGGSVNGDDPAALRAAIQAGPQTQDALDIAMLTYTPAQLQAAFPEYGGVSDYNKAAAEARARVEQQTQIQARAAAQTSNQPIVGTDPNRPPATDAQKAVQAKINLINNAPAASKIPQSEIDASQAAAAQAVKDGKLSQSAYNWMQWRQGETDPMFQQRIGTELAQKGVNPYDPAFWQMGEQAATTAANRAQLTGQDTTPWMASDWQAKQKARNDAADAAAAKAAADAANSPFRAGPSVGPGPVTGGTTGGTAGGTTGGSMSKATSTTGGGSDANATPAVSRPSIDKATLQSYYNQYFTDGVPVGYKQDWANGKLEKITDSTAVYTDSRGKQYVMQKGMDVNNIYSMSPDIANQWQQEYGYTYSPQAQTGANLGTPTGSGVTSNTTQTPYSIQPGVQTPYGKSQQGILTPQGVMGGSEKGGTVANVSQIVPAYQQYWQNAKIGDTMDWAGGTLTRTGGAQAVYTGKDGSTYSLSPTSDLNIIAAQNPAIANQWQQEFGMVPQNYMTGESARAYEFLRGNAPYSVNQQNRGISRPYNEMALGMAGPQFGSNAVLNQQAINEANAAKTTAPAPQYGYGVINPGVNNMQTVYDPSTQQYVTNNMYTDPSLDLQAKVAANPDAAAKTAANGGMMARGGLSDIAQHYNLGDYSDGGRLLRGPGDGVSDSIPATIGGKREARLADGEFVVPARIVSELGNGSTEAGARQLYAMMDRIQHNRGKSIGKGKVAVNSKSSKFLPA